MARCSGASCVAAEQTRQSVQQHGAEGGRETTPSAMPSSPRPGQEVDSAASHRCAICGRMRAIIVQAVAMHDGPVRLAADQLKAEPAEAQDAARARSDCSIYSQRC